MQITSLSQITTQEQLEAFIQERSAGLEDILSECEDLSQRFSFYAADKMREFTIIDVADVIRICDEVIDNYKVHEYHGGLNATSGYELIVAIEEFNLAENSFSYRVSLTQR